MTQALRYRPDIDGLRALAIAQVVAFHYGVTTLAGGFVGVDVFFVISGYLITALLLDEQERGWGWILRFYERRARRILPALFVVLAATSVLAWCVMLPQDLARYGTSLAATAGFVSNLHFWPSGGYFDPIQVRPLLHTWSLAVEEQFYLSFPLLIWAVTRFLGGRLSTVLAMTWALSFALSVWGASAHPVASFYLPVTRAWELLTGALLAAGVLPAFASGHPRSRDALAWGGLAAVLAAPLLIDGHDALPGWLALVPCLGTAALIWAGQDGQATVTRWLSHRALVALGLISFSLYLWHWPLRILLEYRLGRTLDAPELLMLLAVVLALSAASWRAIERPFRGAHGILSRRAIFGAALVLVATTVAIGLGIRGAEGFPDRLPAAAAHQLASGQREVPWYETSCVDPVAGSIRAEPRCRTGAAGAKPSFIVWGDSHAERLAIPIGRAAAAQGSAGSVAATYSCPPLLDTDAGVVGCAESNLAVLRLVQREQIGLVFLVAQWATYTEGYNYWKEAGPLDPILLADGDTSARSIDENRRVFRRRLDDTIQRLQAAGARVVIVGPTPEVRFSVPESLALATWHGLATPTGPTLGEFRTRQTSVLSAIATSRARHAIGWIDPATRLCAASCAIERDGVPLYNDDNHLSLAGLALIEPLFRELGFPALPP